jgi:hypothetical protein
MSKTTNDAGWKRAMAHAWLGFILLLAFYLLTFGIPRGHTASNRDQHPENAWEEGQEPLLVGDVSD